ncbi:CapA family protein [Miltoncostaea oceani]|uniref:CapA family protein n=1 Tax=Miltoncostaea oceani TaxID=2843216 RepID=UPI001C3C90F8|nr:CapA family protein [Miltoncostaea oceani]
MEQDRQARRRAQRDQVRRRRRTVLALFAVMIAAVGVAAALQGGGGSSGEALARPGQIGPGTSASTTTTPAPPVPGGRAITVAAAGDTVMGSLPYGLPPDGGRSFFSRVDDLLVGDVVLGNLEGTLATGGSSKCGAGSSNCFAFRTPPSYARWLKQAGFTVMTLANNHAYDFGASAQRETVAALTRVGVRNTGRPGTVATQVIDGQRVAILGFAPYEWADSLLDIPRAKRRVQEVARSAQIVIVTFHGGAEGSDRTRVPNGPETYLGEPRGDLRRFSRAVVDAGADLVVGHGPHVLRGMEMYKGRLIAYSLGNFAGYEVFSLGGLLSTSMVLQVTLEPDGRLRTGRIRPTSLVGAGTPAPGVDAITVVRRLSRLDFGARAPRIDAQGVIRPRT